MCVTKNTSQPASVEFVLLRRTNYARGGLVDEAALLEALADGRVAAYVTDFPSDALLGAKGVICTPHLGASTPESEENCAVMAARQLLGELDATLAALRHAQLGRRC